MIEVKALTKTFASHVALKGVEFSVNAGEIFGIIGKSGAGKSTLMRLLTFLDRPTSGKIIIDGIDSATLDVKTLRIARKKIGMIFQHFNLLSSRTALENICLPLELGTMHKREREERGKELLKLVGLEHKANNYPSNLSGGEKQRVAIARALANNPSLLFSDESTSALDPTTTNAILELLSTLNRTLGITIVLITHQMHVVKQICHKMAVLEEGVLVEQGRVEDLFVAPQNALTKELLQGLTHDIPASFFGGGKKLFHLSFKGKSAAEPIMSRMIKQFDVEVNILLGGIDSLQTAVIGNLVVEIKGGEVEQACHFLKSSGVSCEPL